MKPIELSKDIRIIDLDDKQYAIQKRRTSTDKKTKVVSETWSSVRFCVSLKSLVYEARDQLAAASARKARTASHEAFEKHGIESLIMSLPPKTKKGN